MIYRGHVKDGMVVFDESVELPDGTEVRVDIVEQPSRCEEKGRTLLERLQPVCGQAEGLPDDASFNVDHYLYNHPKK